MGDKGEGSGGKGEGTGNGVPPCPPPPLYSMGFMSSEFPVHSRIGIPLLSLNVLVLLELWHGGGSWIRCIPSVGTQCISVSFQYHE